MIYLTRASLTFLIVGHEGLGEGLPDGVDLAGVSAALDPDADVDVGEAVLAQEKDRLLQLVLQGSGLHQLEWPAVDLRWKIKYMCMSHLVQLNSQGICCDTGHSELFCS